MNEPKNPLLSNVGLEELLQGGKWEGECFVWSGKVHHTFGYGRLKRKGQMYTVHRIRYALQYGDPGDKFILHTCDNHRCYRIEHLYAGTQHDNLIDATRNGMWKKGEDHPKSTLSDAQIIEIYQRVNPSVLPEVPFGHFSKMAKEYGVSSRLISYIREKRRRADLLKDL